MASIKTQASGIHTIMRSNSHPRGSRHATKTRRKCLPFLSVVERSGGGSYSGRVWLVYKARLQQYSSLNCVKMVKQKAANIDNTGLPAFTMSPQE